MKLMDLLVVAGVAFSSSAITTALQAESGAGNLELRDAEGRVRLHLGQLAQGRYGIALLSEDGTPVTEWYSGDGELGREQHLTFYDEESFAMLDILGMSERNPHVPSAKVSFRGPRTEDRGQRDYASWTQSGLELSGHAGDFIWLHLGQFGVEPGLTMAAKPLGSSLESILANRRTDGWGRPGVSLISPSGAEQRLYFSPKDPNRLVIYSDGVARTETIEAQDGR